MSWECDYHTSTELYARRFSGKAGEMILCRQNELLSLFLRDIEGKKVLDIGAGHGQTVEVVFSKGGHLTAYGSSEDNFHQLRKLIKELPIPEDKGYRVEFGVGKLYELPFEEKSFDVVISLRMISHVPDWTIFLKELCRVARDSVIIDFAPRSILTSFSFILKGKMEVASRRFTTQNLNEIKSAAEESGFILRNYERQFMIPVVIHRMLKSRLFLPLERIARKLRITRFLGGPVIAVFDRE